MLSVLVLGFLIGLQHATEADHLAAVASLSTDARSLREAATLGMVWGLGHTTTLVICGGAVLLAGRVIPDKVAQGLEFAVGVMLIVLGASALRRVVRNRLHFHIHAHGAQEHYHAHSHYGHANHAQDLHHHGHCAGFSMRALLVGMIHGMAGSAALIVLALGAVDSLWQGLLYIVLFGVGSVIGMAVLGAAISVPLRYSARGLTLVHNGLEVMVSVVTVGFGLYIVYDVGLAGGLLV